MSELTQQILKANERFVKQSLSQGGFDEVSKYPSRNLAVLTCMDTRLLSFLEPAMGLVRGEAKLIKVAGNTAFEDFDSVIGSLMVAVYELHVHDIIVMGHDDCGMLKTTADSLCRHMQKKVSMMRPSPPSGPSWNNGPTPLLTSMRPSVIRSAACGPIPTCLHPLRFMVWSSIRTPVKSESSTMEKARNRRYYESCHTTNERPCRCPRSDDGFDSGY